MKCPLLPKQYSHGIIIVPTFQNIICKILARGQEVVKIFIWGVQPSCAPLQLRGCLRRANTERSLIKNTRQRQLSFLGNIMRKEKIKHIVVTGKIEGKKSRGRARLTYISSLSKCTGLSEVELLCNTKNRALWRTMIANVRIG